MGKCLITAKFPLAGPLACRVVVGPEHGVLMPGSVSATSVKPAAWSYLKEVCNGAVAANLHGEALFRQLGYNAVKLAYVLFTRLADSTSQKDVQEIVGDLKTAVAIEKENSGSSIVTASASVPETVSRHSLNRFFVAVIKRSAIRLAHQTEQLAARLDAQIAFYVNQPVFEKAHGAAFLMGLSTNKKSGAVVCGDAEPTSAALDMVRTEKNLLPLYESLYEATANPMFKLVGG